MFQNLSPARRIVLLAAVVVIAGSVMFLAYRFLLGSDASKTAAVNPILLKCTDPRCGETFRTTLQDVWARRTKSPPTPGSPGLPCPKCGQSTQASAAECPTDHTIFLTDPADRAAKDIVWSEGLDRHPVCPKCRWDPLAPRAAGR